MGELVTSYPSMPYRVPARRGVTPTVLYDPAHFATVAELQAEMREVLGLEVEIQADVLATTDLAEASTLPVVEPPWYNKPQQVEVPREAPLQRRTAG
jgi:hypothetical protein